MAASRDDELIQTGLVRGSGLSPGPPSPAAVAGAPNVVKGDLLVAGKLKWKNSRAFIATLLHSITANRAYTFPDASGNVPALPTAATTETGSGALVRTTSPTIVTPDVQMGAWSTWVPTYSSDIGNAAATFTATPTTVRARYQRMGKLVHCTVVFTATLKAVTPAAIFLTLPVTPLHDDGYGAALVLNGAAYETGIIRTQSSGSLVMYRSGVTAWSSGANVEGKFSFTFELS